LIIFLLAGISARSQQPVFNHISDQLVNNEVTSIIQDKKGFIWFGTRGGLQRFNGYEMRLLKNDLGNHTNLSSHSIEVLQNGRKDNIWIGTKSGGLSAYDLKTGNITNYNNPNQNVKGFNADYVLSILDTDSEKLLVGTWKGFQYLDKSSGRFTVVNTVWKTFDIQPDGKDGFWLATNGGLKHLTGELVNDASYSFDIPFLNITSVARDPEDNILWLGTWGQGLIRFDPVSKAVRFYRHVPGKPGSISSDDTYRIYPDSKGGIWIGTWGGGLNYFDRETETFRRVHLEVPGLYTNDNQIILTIQEDPSGLLWVGTDGTGVFKHDLNQKKFHNIGYSSQYRTLSGSTHILAVFVDKFNKLWIGRKGAGIQYSSNWEDEGNDDFRNLETDANSNRNFEGRSFLQVGEHLWVGTNNGLLRILNDGRKAVRAEVFVPKLSDSTTISGRKITMLVHDSLGRIWIGTQESGLSRITGYDQKNRPLFRNYLPKYNEKEALQNERVSALLADSRNRLWIGTYKGLHLYNEKADNFVDYLQDDKDTNSISNNTILCLAEDDAGNIWAGTQSGLNRISITSSGKLNVKRYTTREGLPNDYIHSVIPDRNGIVWMGTNKGIIRLNTLTNSINVFDKRDGIHSLVFSENAFFRDSRGRYFFGGLEGLTYFFPDSIRINNFAPPVYFTNLSVNNQPYEFGRQGDDAEVLTRPLSETESLTLKYTQNIFSIEFAALDFHAPDKNEYMYKLEGFHKDWVNADRSRLVSFTNLKAGTYQLKVKATNSDKIWNSGMSQLTIHVLPPPWKTWWAYTIYISLFIFLLWLTRHLGLRELTLKNQLALARLDREQEKKMTHFKERLFTNISHEFRTPLTLILGPLEDLMQRRKMDPVIEKSLRLIQKQSKRMLRMVNQLLDFQKAEAGSLVLTAQPGEIVSFCYDIYTLFRDEAQRKNIDYNFEWDEKYLSYNFDHNKVEIIVFNLLSNAFKFTGKGGRITLFVRKKGEFGCEIVVEDSGSGIPAPEIDRIFDRFYRGKEMDATTISGTGIGLSFVKELVELHGGTIVAESDGATGSTFRVSFPSLAGSDDYIMTSDGPLLMAEPSINTAAMLDEKETPENEQDLPIILVVEDEADIMEYICDILAPSYKLITATNGREGLAIAMETIPDLIVSDIMMPEMDGMELCRTLKSDKRTSHIPIILLTALSDMAHHIQGIKEGADVYLPKPFNSQLLLVHIHNLKKSRDTLKELYARRVILGVGNFEIRTYEEEFLAKLMKLVEENVTNSEFCNDDLANLMFMSRSTFYRKLKAVTGMSGNEFIRTARLNYAMKLLQSGNYSVTEAALEAGFNDIKYFRKRFQDQFGTSPSEYKKA